MIEKKRTRRLRRGPLNMHRVDDDMRNNPLEKTLRERDERQTALERRTAAQTLLGDPPQGYSALDRRTRGSV
jgi:hypothetical protein